MAVHQNTTIDSTKLIIGNFKIETATSGTTVAAATWVNLGAGKVNKFGHNITEYNTQAGNAPDPIEGISDETFTIDAELIEYDASVLSAISGGALVADTTVSTQSVLSGGGQMTITPCAFKLTNRRTVSGATKQTILHVFNAKLSQGLQYTAKSDNDADPVAVIAISIEAWPLTTLSAGSQLFKLYKDI